LNNFCCALVTVAFGYGTAYLHDINLHNYVGHKEMLANNYNGHRQTHWQRKIKN